MYFVLRTGGSSIRPNLTSYPGKKHEKEREREKRRCGVEMTQIHTQSQVGREGSTGFRGSQGSRKRDQLLYIRGSFIYIYTTRENV